MGLFRQGFSNGVFRWSFPMGAPHAAFACGGLFRSRLTDSDFQPPTLRPLRLLPSSSALNQSRVHRTSIFSLHERRTAGSLRTLDNSQELCQTTSRSFGNRATASPSAPRRGFRSAGILPAILRKLSGRVRSLKNRAPDRVRAVLAARLNLVRGCTCSPP